MENSKIEWTEHTFNPWEGCVKISPGCKHCYADAQHQLHHSSLKTQAGTCWGVGAPRLGKSAENWKKPLKWNREAQAAGVRARVFCASMADVFEAQSELSRAFAGQTNQVPIGGGKTRTVTFVDIAAERLRLLRLIYDTPHLDWLLLTKRPEHIEEALYEAWKGAVAAVQVGEKTTSDPAAIPFANWLAAWMDHQAPTNVWLGTSVENQEQADARIPHLLNSPAHVHFLSMEPLLGPVDISEYVGAGWEQSETPMLGPVDWVIVGGESGPKARPMHPDWARSLRDQCQAAGVPFFFKQFGEWSPVEAVSKVSRALYPDGKHMNDLTGRGDNGPTAIRIWLTGKKEAGRQLDGREWSEVPQGKEVARAG